MADTDASRDLDHSRPLDVHRWSEHPEANKFVNRIWEAHFKQRFSYSGKGKRPKGSPKTQLKVLLLDLYVAWSTDPELVIGVPMAAASFKAGSRYNALHISKVFPDIVHHAHDAGLIDLKLGSEAAGITTRVWPTELLLKDFRDAKFGALDIGRYADQEVIILSNESKELEYQDSDNPMISTMRADLRKYNELLSRTFIDIPTLDHPVIEQTVIQNGKEELRKIQIGQHNKLVRRIFYRGSWDLGGRFHGGWWQQIKSDWRKQIYINDEPTVEQDYSGLHVNLLYGLKGLRSIKDPYSIALELNMEPTEQRKCVKSLALMAINAKTEKKAFQAFRSEQQTGTKEKSLKDKTLKTILEAFKEKNAPIADDLCKDKGVELMAIDGRITAKIIKHFTTKNNPILTVHDSYITSHEHTGLLRTLMNQATSEELGGLEINIEQEGVGIDQYRAFTNMDRMNNYYDMLKAIPAYDRTEGYRHRYEQFVNHIKNHQ